MAANEIAITERLPTVDGYQALRETAGWGQLNAQQAQRGLKNTLYSVCAIKKKKAIALGE